MLLVNKQKQYNIGPICVNVVGIIPDAKATIIENLTTISEKILLSIIVRVNLMNEELEMINNFFSHNNKMNDFGPIKDFINFITLAKCKLSSAIYQIDNFMDDSNYNCKISPDLTRRFSTSYQCYRTTFNSLKNLVNLKIDLLLSNRDKIVKIFNCKLSELNDYVDFVEEKSLKISLSEVIFYLLIFLQKVSIIFYFKFLLSKVGFIELYDELNFDFYEKSNNFKQFICVVDEYLKLSKSDVLDYRKASKRLNEIIEFSSFLASLKSAIDKHIIANGFNFSDEIWQFDFEKVIFAIKACYICFFKAVLSLQNIRESLKTIEFKVISEKTLDSKIVKAIDHLEFIKQFKQKHFKISHRKALANSLNISTIETEFTVECLFKLNFEVLKGAALPILEFSKGEFQLEILLEENVENFNNLMLEFEDLDSNEERKITIISNLGPLLEDLLHGFEGSKSSCNSPFAGCFKEKLKQVVLDYQCALEIAELLKEIQKSFILMKNVFLNNTGLKGLACDIFDLFDE